jgi:hypothetical protein
MPSDFEEKRRFFLEVIDDIASEEIAFERMSQIPLDVLERETREEDALLQAEAAAEAEAEDDGLSSGSVESADPTPERYRETLTRRSDERLLGHRRFLAKGICEAVAYVGAAHRIEVATVLASFTWRLQAHDAEIARRHLDRK